MARARSTGWFTTASPSGSGPNPATQAVKAAGSEAAVMAHSSTEARWLIWSLTLHPSAGLGLSQAASSRPATWASMLSCSAARSARSSARTFGSAIPGPRSLEHDQHGALLHPLPFDHPDLDHLPVVWRRHPVLHLHRLDGHQKVSGLDGRPHLGRHPHDHPGQRGGEGPGLGPALGGGEPLDLDELGVAEPRIDVVEGPGAGHGESPEDAVVL